MRLGAVLAYHHWVALVVRSRTRGFGKGKVGRSGLGPVSWLRRCDGGCHENGGTLWMGMVCNGGRGGSMAWMREVVGCGLGWNGTIVVVGRLVHQAHGGGSARGWRHGKGKAARHGKPKWIFYFRILRCLLDWPPKE